MGVVPIVGSNWFDGLCLCVWLCCWFDVCVYVYGCGDGFG